MPDSIALLIDLALFVFFALAVVVGWLESER
jgi:hypothetical protein